MSICRRALAMAGAGSVVIIGVVVASLSVSAQAQQRNRKPDKAQQQDADALTRLVNQAQAGGDLPSDLPVSIRDFHYFKAASGATYVPFTILVDTSKASSSAVAVMLRVVKQGATSSGVPTATNGDGNKTPLAPATFQDLYFLDVKSQEGKPGQFARAFQVEGGDYDVYVAVKEHAPADKNKPKMAVCKQTVSLPNLSIPGDLTTSSVVMLAKEDELKQQLSVDEQREHPYAIGSIEIVPAAGTKLATTDPLDVFFQIYNYTLVSPGNKPDVIVEYNFYRKLDSGEKYFNKTEPTVLNASTVNPMFDGTKHQLPGGIGIPAGKIPVGSYRLEIKVTDKPSGKTLTRSLEFSVS
jgi:hypothetical protein